MRRQILLNSTAGRERLETVHIDDDELGLRLNLVLAEHYKGTNVLLC